MILILIIMIFIYFKIDLPNFLITNYNNIKFIITTIEFKYRLSFNKYLTY